MAHLLLVAALLGLCQANSAYDALRSSYIFKGEEAKLEEFPFVVALQLFAHYTWIESETGPRLHTECAGSIINDRWIVTATHCFLYVSHNLSLGADITQWTVVAGAHNISATHASHRYHNLEKAVHHPEYNSSFLKNDITLAKIKGRFELNAYSMSPIALPPPSSNGDDLKYECCTLIGWGSIDPSHRSDVLRKVNLPIDKPSTCASKYRGAFESKYQFCMGYRGSNMNGCGGDSGGPVMCFKNNTKYLAGIVSYGPPWCDMPYPNVCTRVSAYREWIDEIIRTH